MTNNSIRVNRSNSTIEVLAAFEKKARIYGSDEYMQLEEACSIHPAFKVVIIKRKSPANCKIQHLTYDKMEKFISKHRPEILDEFKKKVSMDDDEGEKSAYSYGEIRKWFLDQFPEIKKQNKVA